MLTQLKMLTQFDAIGYYESVIAVFGYGKGKKAIDIENNFEGGQRLTFDDVNKICKANGYKSGTILLLCESYLDGEVFRYGNYHDEYWYKIGDLKGFA